MSTVATRKKAFLVILEKSMGVVTTAADKFGMDRSVHYKWMKSDPKYKKAVEDIENRALDFAESKLFELISGAKVKEIKTHIIDGKIVTQEVTKQYTPDTTATIFYLKTKGKDRGYNERIEHTGPNGKPIDINENVTFYLPDNGRNKS